MRRIAAFATAAVLLVLPGCGDDDEPVAESSDPPSAASSEDTEGDDSSEPTANCVESPEVTVSDPGAEPRTLMEFSPEVGQTSAIDVRMAASVSLQVDGTDMSGPPPITMIMGAVFTIDDVTDEHITISYEYDRVEAEGDDPAVDAALEPLVGVNGTITTTRNGAFVEGDIDLDGVDPAMAQTLGQLESQLGSFTLPLPSEPVGVGAEWSVETSFELNGVVTCQTATYRLVSFDGTAYELETEAVLQVPPTTLELDGASADVIDGHGTITGHSSGTLDLPIAVTATGSGGNSIIMEIEQDGTTQNQTVQTDIDMEITERQ